MLANPRFLSSGSDNQQSKPHDSRDTAIIITGLGLALLLWSKHRRIAALRHRVETTVQDLEPTNLKKPIAMSSPDLILLDAPPTASTNIPTAEAKTPSPASIHIKELNAIDQVCHHFLLLAPYLPANSQPIGHI